MDEIRDRFLTAEWRYLAMINYEIEAGVLRPLVPAGTELDLWQGRAVVSMVGFLFQKTRLLGVPVPGHRHFEEVNLRFYVRRKGPEGWRRGVVFVKEIVPKPAIAAVARLVYNENYVSLPMRHRVVPRDGGLVVEYLWASGGGWHHMRVDAVGETEPIAGGSEAEFITEHYWGYARQRDGGTVEYQVAHPRWNVWPVVDHSLAVDAAALYGPAFGEALAGAPTSVFLADGSAVVVGRGRRLVAP